MKRVCSLAVLASVLLTVGVGAGVARADGLPVLGVDVGGTGVTALAGDARYVTLPAGRKTVVARVDPVGGRVLGSRLLNGKFTIPAVAYDGSASGLAADGKTLVLIESRTSFPRAQTAFRVLAAPQLVPLTVVRLRGDFSFDAISPHGNLMYLIQYISATDPSRYLVRAYNLDSGRLLKKPVTDPREQTEKMRGIPLTRATSPDGRWAYTLYDGSGTTPFIHALDTSARTARCIDLDELAGSDLSQIRLRVSPDGATLSINDRQQPVALLDTRTFQLSAPQPAASSRDRQHRPSFPRSLLAISTIAVLVALAAFASARRRRQRPAIN